MHSNVGKLRTRVAEDLTEWLIELEWLAKQYSAGAAYTFCYYNCGQTKIIAKL